MRLLQVGPVVNEVMRKGALTSLSLDLSIRNSKLSLIFLNFLKIKILIFSIVSILKLGTVYCTLTYEYSSYTVN